MCKLIVSTYYECVKCMALCKASGALVGKFVSNVRSVFGIRNLLHRKFLYRKHGRGGDDGRFRRCPGRFSFSGSGQPDWKGLMVRTSKFQQWSKAGDRLERLAK